VVGCGGITSSWALIVGFSEHGVERVRGSQHDVDDVAGWTYQFIDVDHPTERIDRECLEPLHGQQRASAALEDLLK
jgi:hypothetical protein